MLVSGQCSSPWLFALFRHWAFRLTWTHHTIPWCFVAIYNTTYDGKRSRRLTMDPNQGTRNNKIMDKTFVCDDNDNDNVTIFLVSYLFIGFLVCGAVSIFDLLVFLIRGVIGILILSFCFSFCLSCSTSRKEIGRLFSLFQRCLR